MMYRFDWLSQNPVRDMPHFLVGRDRAGHWIATDMHGLRGGVFIDQASAIRYAELEASHAPGAVQLVDGRLELCFGTTAMDKTGDRTT